MADIATNLDTSVGELLENIDKDFPEGYQPGKTLRIIELADSRIEEYQTTAGNVAARRRGAGGRFIDILD